MLTITYDGGACVEWHVGEKMPKLLGPDRFMLDEQNVCRITQLQADGHELERIKEMFVVHLLDAGNTYTIPMPNTQVCRWYGDFARTIYLSLYDWKVEQL